MSLDNDLECGADVHRLVDSLKFPALQACLHVNCGKFSLSLLNRSMFCRQPPALGGGGLRSMAMQKSRKHMGKSCFKSRKNWKKIDPSPHQMENLIANLFQSLSGHSRGMGFNFLGVLSSRIRSCGSIASL